MDIILLITSIVVIVFGVLQVILFFKIWGMTNDTKKIKNTVQANGYPSGISPAKIEFAIGNTEKAKEMAYREFLFDVCKVYSEVSVNTIMSEQVEYTQKFSKLESEYKAKYDNATSFIDFEKFSTFEKAKELLG